MGISQNVLLTFPAIFVFGLIVGARLPRIVGNFVWITLVSTPAVILAEIAIKVIIAVFMGDDCPIHAGPATTACYAQKQYLLSIILVVMRGMMIAFSAVASLTVGAVVAFISVSRWRMAKANPQA